jgi:hypothetical protein
MHIAIGLFMGLFSFSAIMILWNVTAHYKDFNFIADGKEISNKNIV